MFRVSFLVERFQSVLNLQRCVYLLLLVATYIGGGSMHCVPSSGADLAEVIVKLTPCSKVLSADCTRLAVVFHQAPPPSAQECGVVCRKVEQSALQMAAAFYQLNIKHGIPLIHMNGSYIKLVIGFYGENGCSLKLGVRGD